MRSPLFASLLLASAFVSINASAQTEGDNPGPGHVILLHVAPVTHAVTAAEGAAPAATAPAPAAPGSAPVDDDDDDPKVGPVTGFSIEGRLRETISPMAVTAPTPFALTAPPPYIALGYRGARYGLYLSPVLDHFEWNNQAVTIAGIGAHVEADLSQSTDRNNELYFLAGGSFAMAALSQDPGHVSGRSAVSLFAGVGARHWVTRNLGVNAEIGEGFATVPVDASGGGGHATSFGTFGTIGLTLAM